MTEADVGKVFLFAVPWDWTFVGRFEGIEGDRLIITQAGYFTRPGATFNKLCQSGFVSETKFNRIMTSEGRMKIPNQGPVWPWEATWPQKGG